MKKYEVLITANDATDSKVQFFETVEYSPSHVGDLNENECRARAIKQACVRKDLPSCISNLKNIRAGKITAVNMNKW